MSASNWRHCPICERKELAELQAEKTALEEKIGSEPGPEREQAIQGILRVFGRMETIEDRDDDTENPRLREDYEIWTDKNGFLRADYHGECQDCGAKFSWELPPVRTTFCAPDAGPEVLQ